MAIYIGNSGSGKTTMLINESAKTGYTIAVANYYMVRKIAKMADEMGLYIPRPVTYDTIFANFQENKNTRYLVDNLHMMISQLGIVDCTVDSVAFRFLSESEYAPSENDEKRTDDRHLKILAFLSGILAKISQGDQVDENERKQLENIASELGYYDLDAEYFRY